MRNILVYVLTIVIFLGCSKDGTEPDPQGSLGGFKLNQSHNPVAVGQKVFVTADLSETADIAWKFFYNGVLEAEFDFDPKKTVTIHATEEPGDYKVVAMAKQGTKSAESSIVIKTLPIDFGVGLWNQPDSVIIATKALNGIEPVGRLVTSYNPFESIDGLERIVFDNTTAVSESYFFRQKKLVGGSSLIKGRASTPNGTNNDWYYRYLSQVNALNEKFGVPGKENRDWILAPDKRTSYERDNFGIGLAVEHRWLNISTTWDLEKETAEVRLLFTNDTNNMHIVVLRKIK